MTITTATTALDLTQRRSLVRTGAVAGALAAVATTAVVVAARAADR